MPKTTRTFVALTVPDNLGVKLTRLQSLLAPDIPGVRWSAIPPFHLTLAFLGDVAQTDLNAVCKVVAQAAADVPPFELRLEKLGVFPDPSKPRVVWVGIIGPGLDALAELQRRVVAAVDSIGYRADDRFHPHVTLGRMTQGRGPGLDVTPWLNHYRTWAAGSFRVAEVVTFASALNPEGPVYSALGRTPLNARKPRPTA